MSVELQQPFYVGKPRATGLFRENGEVTKDRERKPTSETNSTKCPGDRGKERSKERR